jgi:hypothetical protein
MPRIRLLPILAAALLCLAGAPAVQAGQYRLAYDFASDLSDSTSHLERSPA